MQIDILSDTHFDYYFGIDNIPDEKTVVDFWNKLGPKSDYFILAGDIGHNNQQNIAIFKALRKNFYKNVFLVAGNHELYLIFGQERKYQDSWQRLDEMKELCAVEEGLHFLDGESITVGGKKFAGTMSWYDGTYDQVHFGHSKEKILELWQKFEDSQYIKGTKDFYELWEKEKPKIEKISQDCDLMITHINPSIRKEHQTKEYIDAPSTAFFNFDGIDYVEKTRAQFWILGHTHKDIDYTHSGTRVLVNALGYPEENINGLNQIKQIEL